VIEYFINEIFGFLHATMHANLPKVDVKLGN